MKSVQLQSAETFEFKGFEILTSDEMLEVKGGTGPRSRDKDLYDLEEE